MLEQNIIKNKCKHNSKDIHFIHIFGSGTTTTLGPLATYSANDGGLTEK